MEKQKYLGGHKVIGIAKEEGETPLGSEIVKVLLEGQGHSVIMSKVAFDAFTTETAIDANLLQELKFNVLIPKMRSLFIEYFVVSSDMTPLLNKAGHSFSDDYDRAANFLWTKDDSKWVPGMSFNIFTSMLEADQIIKTIPPKDETGKDTENKRGSGGDAPKGDKSDPSYEDKV